MKNKAALAGLASFVLWCTSIAAAQNSVQITNLHAQSVAGNSATISWNTNTPSSAVVRYGTDAYNLSQTADGQPGRTEHVVQLNNLQPNTTYYYEAISAQGQGGGGMSSGINTFKTPAQGSVGQAPPAAIGTPAANAVQITNLHAQNVTGNTATITWSTNIPASATVKYGTDAYNLTQTAQAPWGGTDHTVQLNNLQPNTMYYYEVVSAEGQGNGGGMSSGINTFKTQASGTQSVSPGAGTPGRPIRLEVLGNPIAQNITSTSAQVTWNTNRPASTIVKYGTDPNNLSRTAEKAWGATNHEVQLNNLQPDTDYYLVVQEEGGRELARSQFHTLPSGR